MSYQFVKRFFDIFFSIIAIIIFSPIFSIISILILIFDNGPIIFKQRRVGHKKFIIYKFRSLPISTKNIPSISLEKIKITKIGKLLRRTNADELPQLINILKGDMSFVGPRPCLDTQQELIKLRKLNNVCDLRAGLTGLAQVNSYNGMSLDKKSLYEEIYLRNISFILDFSIILKTFFYLLKEPPKY